MAINPATFFLKPIVVNDLKLFQDRNGAVDSEELLEKCETIKDSEGRTALSYFGRTEICRYLIENVRVNINIKDDKGCTPLFLAVREGYFNLATYLILRGADVSKKTNKGKAAIHYAARKGSKELLDLLITYNAYIEAIYDHQTPLIISIDVGSVDCVKLLLEAGADSNKSSHGVDPLVFAALRVNDTQFIRLLLGAGADPNRRDMTSLTPLEQAIRAGNNDGAAILFPRTSRDPSVSDWSIDGITMHIHSEEWKNQRELKKEEIFVSLKEKGEAAFEREDNWTAVLHYTQALFIKPNDAMVLSLRFRCWLRMKRIKRAIKDAVDAVRNANGLEHRNLDVAARLILGLPDGQLAIALEGNAEPEAYIAMRRAFY